MNFNLKHSFAFRLSLYIITSVVIIFLIVLFYNFLTLRELILKDNRENIQNLRQSTLNRIDISLVAARKVPEELANTLECVDLSKAELISLLRKVVSSNKEIYGSTIAFDPHKYDKSTEAFAPYYYKTREGDLKYADLSKGSYDYFKKEWYIKPIELSKGVWSEPYFDDGGGDSLMVTYSQPFYRVVDGKREIYGVVTCDIQLDWLADMISEIHILQHGYAFILSSKGIFIAHPNKTYYTTSQSFFSLAEKYKEPDERIIGERMTKGETGFVKYFSQTLQQKSIVFFQPLEKTGWSLGIVIPEDELFSRLNTITVELFIIGFLGYILTLGLIIYLSTRATIPLRKLAKAAFRIGQGDLAISLPTLKTSDEIGVLNSSFKNMQDNLIKYIENLQEATKALITTQEVTIECMASVAEFRDPETGLHIRRTQIYVRELAVYLKNNPRFKDFLDDEAINMLYLSAPLHDVGKVAIPDNILLKQGKLTDEEFGIMRKHPIYGRDAIAEAEKKLTKRSFLRFARDIAASHHEKFDGTGYPSGLKGDEIPIPGRLMALADVYDALVTKRVYKPAFSHDKAKQIIIEGRGTHFDPDVVDAFLALEDKFREIAVNLADKSEPLKDQSIHPIN
ncbi:MAG TPA: hypothetical protein DD381_12840 [Lentisphaeria bacterium]|nr:MAG: hypothetical protein A2X47_12410 [Lentisphaerae bacterium GWF2_38_69]HBM17211.1 hypothetical protein [Lentisphaeria bacterium]